MGLFHRSKAGVETPLEVDGIDGDPPPAETTAAPAGTLLAQAESPEFAKLRADFEASQAKIRDLETRAQADAAEKLATRVAAVKAESGRFAAGLVAANKLMPAGKDHLANLHAFAHLSAAGLPADGIDPVASLTGLVSGLVPHSLTAEAVSDAAAASAGVFRVDNGAAPASPSLERQIAILKDHPSGAAAIALLRKNGQPAG